MIRVPIGAITDGPSVQWDHIDGPLINWAGHMHWLTWGERLAVAVRYMTIEEIAQARFPHLHKMRLSLTSPTPSQGE